ncbi:MAG: hypothetical protein OXD42_14560 [Rhodospirillaceae bacterium]|nr:hypothetical protein [Rhodospirillaceae bacterium]
MKYLDRIAEALACACIAELSHKKVSDYNRKATQDAGITYRLYDYARDAKQKTNNPREKKALKNVEDAMVDRLMRRDRGMTSARRRLILHRMKKSNGYRKVH